MSDIKNLQNHDPALVVPRPWEMLTEVQRTYVDWKALGGLTTDDDGAIKRITLSELADMMGVTIQAFMQSKKTMPNFWDLVHQRRKELSGQSRLAKMHDVWFLKAVEMKNWPLTEAWLRNFDPDYKESHSKAIEDVGNGFADLVAAVSAKKTQSKPAPIEGEIVDANGNTTSHT